MRHAALLLFALLAASSAHASIVTIPANPVAGVPFVVHVVAFCANIGDATVGSTDINIPVILLGNCCGGCFSQRDVPVGPLPAGTYTIRVLATANNNSVIETLPIIVGADIPALDPRVL